MKQPASQIDRCPWPGIEAEIYSRYHDTEWGVPQLDDVALLEKLTLEGFQAGLSWLTILRKRDNFRAAFKKFDPQKVARFGEKDIERLLGDAGIIRHRAKIEAAIGNARAFLSIAERSSFSGLLWGFVDGRPIVHERQSFAQVPAQTEQSKAMSKELKRLGFRFVGPTTAYAFMQSVGMVNDHLVACPRHEACSRLQSKVIVGA
ncbi:MAG: DNA-3-methyladenine glycosylase I [Alphaproteobacteria bacterium]|nr:DNA-3-methyladenine glycosylase I [Alphaproteobacteria bacterium]